jgi:glutamate-1-semialdehyde 2,1-aminomutase
MCLLAGRIEQVCPWEGPGGVRVKRDISNQLYDEALMLMPSGVNSPVRAFLSVNDRPFYVKKAKGAYLYDVDGNAYIDYVASWGAIILGHADDGLIAEVTGALAEGTSYGACHPGEIELARLITDAFPSIERVRLTNSGTEATMSAIRLARGASGKKGVIKFRGCYHGHVDCLLVKAGSGLATYSTPDSAGVPEELARLTYVAEFNRIDSVAAIIEETKDIACLILEPIMGNMGVILPDKGFLEDVRDLCAKKGIILIFDEVITGFRVAYGGVQHLYGITPDLTCLGKIIGGGFPIGAFGGKREIMERLAPRGDVYQAGTLAGNPIAVRAGSYVLKRLKKENPYEALAANVARLSGGIRDIAAKNGVPFHVNATTGMWTGFFSDKPVRDYESALGANRQAYGLFFKHMIESGMFFAPSPFEAAFLTLSHGEAEFQRTLEACEGAFRAVKG